MDVLSAFMSVYYVCSAHGGRRAHKINWNWSYGCEVSCGCLEMNQVLWKSSQYSYLVNYLSSPWLIVLTGVVLLFNQFDLMFAM